MTGLEMGILLGAITFGAGYLIGVISHSKLLYKDSMDFELAFKNMRLEIENEELKKKINEE